MGETYWVRCLALFFQLSLIISKHAFRLAFNTQPWGS